MLAGAAALVLTGCISMEDAYRAIEWRVVVLIAGMLPIGTALVETGLAARIGQAFTAGAGAGRAAGADRGAVSVHRADHAAGGRAGGGPDRRADRGQRGGAAGRQPAGGGRGGGDGLLGGLPDADRPPGQRADDGAGRLHASTISCASAWG